MKEPLTEPVKVEGGLIRGNIIDDGRVKRYLGLPYAAAPTLDKRWKAAEPVVPWEGIRECTSYGKNALQEDQKPFFVWTEEFIIQDTGYSEDCLNLNIWTANDDLKDKPVLVYLHGGGFNTGGSSCEIYDGCCMAKQGLVFLSFNHRVGDAGLYTSPELDAEDDTKTSGNYLLMDEIKLLKWVQTNIRAFGGNPGNVTLMGQSSGAAEINALALSPLAKGLFHKAVVMGLNNYRLKNQTCDWLSKDEAQKLYGEILSGKSLKELRCMSEEEFAEFESQKIAERNSKPGRIMGLYIDGHVIDVDFNKGLNEGRTNDILWMVGMVTNDAFVTDALTPSPARNPKLTKDDIMAELKKQLGQESDEAIRLYDLNGEHFMHGVQEINRDYLMAAMQKIASVRRDTGNADTYVYWLSHVMPGPGSQMAGAFHTSEVPYFLGNLSECRQAFWQDYDYKLANMLPQALATFMKDGKPGNDWQPALNGSYTHIDDEGCHIESMDEEKYAFWQKVFEF